jgi:hypothetical protein
MGLVRGDATVKLLNIDRMHTDTCALFDSGNYELEPQHAKSFPATKSEGDRSLVCLAKHSI